MVWWFWIGLAILAVVGLGALLATQSMKASTRTHLEVSGVVGRGSIRTLLSDAAFERRTKELGVSFKAEQVKRSPTHVAYMYNENLNITYNGAPARIFGFKDKAHAGQSTIDYGWVVVPSQRKVVAFVGSGTAGVLKARFMDEGRAVERKLVFDKEVLGEQKKVRLVTA